MDLQFDSLEFKNFNKHLDIVHNPSSPLYPRSNGQAERTIQTIKKLMTKALSDKTDIFTVLLDYRLTPMDGSQSPAELLMGRKLQTLVPAP